MGPDCCLCGLASERNRLEPDLSIGWALVSENHGWGQSPVSQVSGESDLVPTCAYGLCWGRAQARNNGACGHFSSRESCLLPLALKVDSSLPPECSWCLQTSAPSLEFSPSVCEQMGLCLSPLRECLVCSSPPSHPD